MPRGAARLKIKHFMGLKTLRGKAHTPKFYRRITRIEYIRPPASTCTR